MTLNARTLVLGAGGQVGQALFREAAKRDQPLCATARTKRDDVRVDRLVDICDADGIEEAIGAERWSSVIIAAGYTAVDRAEEDKAAATTLNATAPGQVAVLAAQKNIRVVYYSTDYVFDGESPPYLEEDETNPLGVYGQTKLDGERAVLAASADNLVLRTSVVFGPASGRKNFLHHVADAAQDGRKMRIVDDQRNNSTYNPELAWATFELLKRGASGVFHATGPRGESRAEFAAMVCEALGKDPASVFSTCTTAELGQAARRPTDATVSTAKLRDAVGRDLWDTERALRDYFRS